MRRSTRGSRSWRSRPIRPRTSYTRSRCPAASTCTRSTRRPARSRRAPPPTLRSWPATLLITPDGRFLYDATTNGIYEFSIDAASGGLTELAGSPVAYHVVPGPGVINPSGKFLYVTNADPSVTSNAQLSAWSIDPQTGELAAISLSASAVTAGPQQSVTIDGSGQFAMVTTAASAVAGTGCFYEFGIDASTGALTPVSRRRHCDRLWTHRHGSRVQLFVRRCRRRGRVPAQPARRAATRDGGVAARTTRDERRGRSLSFRAGAALGWPTGSASGEAR